MFADDWENNLCYRSDVPGSWRFHNLMATVLLDQAGTNGLLPQLASMLDAGMPERVNLEKVE